MLKCHHSPIAGFICYLHTNQEATHYLHHQHPFAPKGMLLFIKAKQRMENMQGLNRRPLAREQRMFRCGTERKLQAPMSYERNTACSISNSLQTFHRMYWKQPPLNDIIDTGFTVKINFIQKNKWIENCLPMKIKTHLQACNYFNAIKAGVGPWAY